MPIPSGTIAGVRLTYAVEPTPLDTAGAIRFAAPHAGIEETFVAINGDVLTDSDLSALVDFHRLRGAEATIGLTPVDDPSAFGVVPTDDEGRVEAFIEKPPRDEAPDQLDQCRHLRLRAFGAGRIPEARRVSIERETFPDLVKARSLYALGSDAYWLDTGTPDAYLRAHRDLLAGRRSGRPGPGRRVGSVDRTRGMADRGSRAPPAPRWPAPSWLPDHRWPRAPWSRIRSSEPGPSSKRVLR